MQFDDLFSTYRFPPNLVSQLQEAFNGIPAQQVSLENEEFRSSFWEHEGESESIYRALERHTSRIIENLYSTPSGKEFFLQLRALLSESKSGVLMKGLPLDNEQKSLFMFGLKSLLGGTKAFGKNFSAIPEYFGERGRVSITDRISRGPLHTHKEYAFHQDHMSCDIPIREHDNPPPGQSFVFLALGQTAKDDMAPTAFKCKDAPDETTIEHVLAEDEILLFNNKLLEHSTGITGNHRHLLRNVIGYTTLTHSMDYGNHAKRLFEEKNIPDDQKELKQWLIENIDSLKEKYPQSTRRADPPPNVRRR